MINEFQGNYRFLSNFYPAKVIYEDIEYPSSEHAYQAAKTLDKNIRKEISKLDSPGKAKRYWKNKSIRSDWKSVSLEVMLDIVRIKFKSNIMLALWLKHTNKQELVEGNKWNDTFWGKCNGIGENHLGKILMQVRDEIDYIE
jgi:N-glycosidase YbiA